MLEFPKEFFEAETREDFLVEAAMKTVWAAQLEVLCEIAKVCERHDLVWYAAFGTLLGAVRHQGYVPWDDDMDICLKRADYMKLLEYLPRELPEGYVVRSPLLETGYPEFHTCVMNSDSISIEPSHLQKFHGCPFIVGIDVFPFDLLPEDEQIRSLQKNLFRLARQGVLMVKNDEAPEKLEEALRGLEECCDVTIDRDYLRLLDEQKKAGGEISEERQQTLEQAKDALAAGLWGLANEIAMCPEEAESSHLAMYLDYFRYDKYYEAQWFEEVEYLPYEGFMIPAPREYDKVLRATYMNYMVRRKYSALHDYPFYNKQLELLRKRVAEFEAGKT